MKAKKAAKPTGPKVKKQQAAPANRPQNPPRELTRAEKTALAREAARRALSTPDTSGGNHTPVQRMGHTGKGTAKKDPKKNVRSGKQSTKRNTAKPVPTAVPKREMTRAEKTAAAREAAARRNAERVNIVQDRDQKKASVKPTAARRSASGLGSRKIQQTEARRELNRKINTQTPAQRQAAKTKKKVSGSVKNIEIKAHSKSKNQSFRVKRKKNRAGRLLVGRLILFFVIFSLMFSLVGGIFALSLRSGKASTSKAYTLQLGADIPEGTDKVVPEEEKPVYVEIPKACAIRYDNLYIPVSALADMCSLTVTGTPSDLRYLPRDSRGHSMRFIVGSDIAYVNGAKIRMISPSFLHEGRLYIPLDFMQKYSEGLSIETDEGNRRITVSKMLEGYDAATDSNIYSVLSFSLSTTTPLDPVNESIE